MQTKALLPCGGYRKLDHRILNGIQNMPMNSESNEGHQKYTCGQL